MPGFQSNTVALPVSVCCEIVSLIINIVHRYCCNVGLSTSMKTT